MSAPIKAIPLGVLCFVLVGAPCSKADWVKDDGVALCTAVDLQFNADIVSDSAGGAIVVWNDDRDDARFIYAQRVDRSGNVLWTNNGVSIGQGSKYDRPQLTVDGQGGAIIAWVYPPNYIYLQRLNAFGVPQWQTRACLTGDGGYHPEICSDDEGGAIVAWGGQDIRVQRVNASGIISWGLCGVSVTTTAHPIYTEKSVVSDGIGGAIVAWIDNDLIIRAQRLDASGIAHWATGGVPLSEGSGSGRFPGIVSDGAGGGIIVWKKFTSDYPDIYAQRLSALGIPLWVPGGVAICTESHTQDYPVIASDGALGAIIAWEDFRYAPSRVYAQRVDASGSIKWTLNGIALCSAGIRPRIAYDGVGGAIVAYAKYVTEGGSDAWIYTQRVDSLGSVLWPEPVVLSTVTFTVPAYEIIPDDESGAIVTWSGIPEGSWDSNIYAQKIYANGHTGVATLLQNCTAIFSDSKIILNWVLSEVDTDVNFFILKSIESNESYIELSSSALCREGLSYSFIDEDWEPNTSYYYRVEYSCSGERKMLFEIGPIVTPTMLLTLFQNSPNPFNPSTTIRYYIPHNCRVLLEVYDIRGCRIACLIDEEQEKGKHAVKWHGKNKKGDSLASGIYFYKLAAGKETISKKMVLLR